MILADLPALTDAAVQAASKAGIGFVALLLSPASPFSIASLLSALAVAGVFLLARRGNRGGRSVSLKALTRALFPSWLRGRSTRTDIGFFLFNSLLFGALFSWAIVTQGAVSGWLLGGLKTVAGPGPGSVLGPVGAMAIGTVALFLTAELAYWITHFWCHRIPALWEIHKVHHSAEVLSPLTNFRVHPIEGLIFSNVLAVMMGGADAGLTWLLGEPAHAFTVYDRNVLALAGLYLVQHLQHTHLWITFPGIAGRLFYSPAHHQIHHSDNPAHFGRNLGSMTTLWDWMFGTLYTPTVKRQRLNFGLGPDESAHHTVMQAMVLPVVRAASALKPGTTVPSAAPEPEPGQATA